MRHPNGECLVLCVCVCETPQPSNQRAVRCSTDNCRSVCVCEWLSSQITSVLFAALRISAGVCVCVCVCVRACVCVGGWVVGECSLCTWQSSRGACSGGRWHDNFKAVNASKWHMADIKKRFLAKCTDFTPALSVSARGHSPLSSYWKWVLI